MRLNQTLALSAAFLLVGAACHKKTPIAAPVPRSTPPPVVPSNPTTAPTPRDMTPFPEIDDITRVSQMPIDEIDRLGLFADIYFDFDQSDLRDGDKRSLQANGEAMKKYYFLNVTIEGHADERGTVEYNLALSDRRARTAYDYLTSIGIPAARLKVVPYGKEIPVCTESNEDCWQRNRRAHFVVSGKTAK